MCKLIVSNLLILFEEETVIEYIVDFELMIKSTLIEVIVVEDLVLFESVILVSHQFFFSKATSTYVPTMWQYPNNSCICYATQHRVILVEKVFLSKLQFKLCHFISHSQSYLELYLKFYDFIVLKKRFYHFCLQWQSKFPSIYIKFPCIISISHWIFSIVCYIRSESEHFVTLFQELWKDIFICSISKELKDLIEQGTLCLFLQGKLGRVRGGMIGCLCCCF